ncbi:MAG: hypothetical protein ACI88H_000449 [Cocleimonas sp.]
MGGGSMAKSPLAKNSKVIKHIRNSKNVIPIAFHIPYRDSRSRIVTDFDISHLLHLSANVKYDRIEKRVPYLMRFCKNAKLNVQQGKSVNTVTRLYEILRGYIVFCDYVKVDPFSEEGYLKFAGNDGELRHRIKMYHPSKKLWERCNGDELGIKETSASGIVSGLRNILDWCGLSASSWASLHRGFTGNQSPFRGYSEQEEKLLVSRLSNLFFTIAPQLIAVKKQNLRLPDELLLSIDMDGHLEVISIKTSLETQSHGHNKKQTSVKPSAAFNLVMGAAYHLMCFFTSLNDSDIQGLAHPIIIHTNERDKSLQVVKVTSFKVRANREVDALLTNESFDINKHNGVEFIKTLETLSKLYGNSDEGSELIYNLNNKGEPSKYFNLKELNKHLSVQLNLLSPNRASTLPWFIELFYSYRNEQAIKISKKTNELGRVIVSKEHRKQTKSRTLIGATNSAYCILSCYTDLPLKGILLPLSYSDKDSEGNINVSFEYRNGDSHFFTIPAAAKTIIQDIELFATELADMQCTKSHERLLLKRGGKNAGPRDWDGISLITSAQMNTWSIEPNEYFISLVSSRWREMTSNQVYTDNGKGSVQSILQNLLSTIDKHYANGDPSLNKIIISQAIQVMEQLSEDITFEDAKKEVLAKLGITMLAHDEWKKKQEKEKVSTNPNGIYCNGQQNTEGKNTQSETNNAMGLKLPCIEYDMCYKCQAAKAVDEVQSIYKLLSFIDVLKNALDYYPDAKGEVHEKISAFELILDGASEDVYEGAMVLFNKNGRHPRVTMDHAILALYR